MKKAVRMNPRTHKLRKLLTERPYGTKTTRAKEGTFFVGVQHGGEGGGSGAWA